VVEIIRITDMMDQEGSLAIQPLYFDHHVLRSKSISYSGAHVYIPEYHRIENQAVALAFMKANPFAILVSGTADGPFATHLPVLVDEFGGKLQLRGHIAKQNPHWKFMTEDQESLVIFHGAHAYISPSLYEIRESVPTWNYAAVHVYGHALPFTDEAQMQQVLIDMVDKFDSSYAAQWSSLTDQYRKRMLNHIVGFEMTATRTETKFKLSQNRTKSEQANVIESLESSEDSTVSAVAQLMKQRGLGLP
jgi:transcriptional regulator